MNAKFYFMQNLSLYYVLSARSTDACTNERSIDRAAIDCASPSMAHTQIMEFTKRKIQGNETV